jgi:DNA-binding transcriptional ArsR family regulator
MQKRAERLEQRRLELGLFLNGNLDSGSRWTSLFQFVLKCGGPDRRYPEVVNEKYPLAATAALIADPARAAMLAAMLEGRAFSSGELARTANISAQSASMHLAQLLQGDLVKVAQQGRHRYYRISSPEVAHAIEALGSISTPPMPMQIRKKDAIRYARTCYDHLAGELAVKLTDAFEGRKWLVTKGEHEFEVTPAGESFFADWRIDFRGLRDQRRSVARRCLDWTERRDHVAGALGAAICDRLLASRWVVRGQKSRVVHLTSSGRQNLEWLLLRTVQW